MSDYLIDISERFHLPNYNPKNICTNGKTLKELLPEELKDFDFEYDRPFFNSPDMNSGDGNTFAFMQIVKEVLSSYGYTKEATEIRNNYMNKKWDTILSEVHMLLDFENSVITKKNSFVLQKTPESLYNLKEFSLTKLSDIQQLYNKNYDFSKSNCYDRTIFNYLDNSTALDFLLSKNKEHQWINIFQLDNLNSSILHQRKNLNSFNVILKFMIDENKNLTRLIFNGLDNFNNSPANDLVNFLSNYTQNYINGNLNSMQKNQIIEAILENFSLLKDIHPEHYFGIIDDLKIISKDPNTNKNKEFNLMLIHLNNNNLNKKVEDILNTKENITSEKIFKKKI